MALRFAFVLAVFANPVDTSSCDFFCSMGGCIPSVLVCNGNWDCWDGSDEGFTCFSNVPPQPTTTKGAPPELSNVPPQLTTTKAAAPEQTTAQGPCDADWTKGPNGCYYFYTRLVAHSFAIDFCVNEGGQLASILSLEEQTFIADKIRTSSTFAFYIGLTDTDIEGFWEWLDGSTLSYTNWADGEPNDWNLDEDCAEIVRSIGQWNDITCHGQNGFICKKNYESSTEPTTFTTAGTDMTGTTTPTTSSMEATASPTTSMETTTSTTTSTTASMETTTPTTTSMETTTSTITSTTASMETTTPTTTSMETTTSTTTSTTASMETTTSTITSMETTTSSTAETETATLTIFSEEAATSTTASVDTTTPTTAGTEIITSTKAGTEMTTLTSGANLTERLTTTMNITSHGNAISTLSVLSCTYIFAMVVVLKFTV